MDATNARILVCKFAHQICGAVRRIIVHVDDFPRNILEAGLDSRGQLDHVLALIECGHDDGDFRSSKRLVQIVDSLGAPKIRFARHSQRERA